MRGLALVGSLLLCASCGGGAGIEPPPPGPVAADLVPALHGDGDECHAAMESLHRIGDAAVSALLPLLDDPDEDVRGRAGAVLLRLDPDAPGALEAALGSAWGEPAIVEVAPAVVHRLAGFAISGDEDLRYMACWYLREWGRLDELWPGARSIVPVLERGLRSTDRAIRWDAALTLAEIAPDLSAPCPVLAEILRAGDSAEKSTAARLLGKMGEGGHGAAAELLSLLADPSESVVAQAAHALPMVGAPAEKAVPALVPLIGSRHDATAWYAADSIGEYGEAAREAVPALIAALDGERDDYVTEALGKLGPVAGEAVHKLLEFLSKGPSYRSKGPGHRTDPATDTLARIGAASVPGLTKLLGGESGIARWQAAEALAAIGPAAEPAVPALREAIRSGEDQRTIALAWCRAAPDSAEALAALMDVIRVDWGKDDPGFPSHLVREGDGHLVPALLLGLNHESAGSRFDFARAIWRATRDPEPVLAPLVDLLTHEETSNVAALVLWDMGTAAAPAVPALLRLLETGPESVLGDVMMVLARSAPEREDVLDAIAARLDHQDADVRLCALGALESIGRPAVRALPALEKAGKHSDADFAHRARRLWHRVKAGVGTVR